MRLAGTRLKNIPSRVGLTKMTKAGPVWNGEVRLNESWLGQPLRWKRPRRIFVCAHGDLFAEGVPDEWIDRVFAVMALSPRHTFQVLTKRPERMRDYVKSWFERLATKIVIVDHPVGTSNFSEMVDWAVLPAILPNVWCGISAERQKEWDERKHFLRDTPARVHFASFEPLLGSIVEQQPISDFIQWAIVGGESGPGSRPVHPDWVAGLHVACVKAGVPFFFKQWGAFGPQSDSPGEPDAYWSSSGDTFADHAVHHGYCFGRNQFQRPRMMFHRPKAENGRALDGIEYSEMPRTA
jgi:protein gp37